LRILVRAIPAVEPDWEVTGMLLQDIRYVFRTLRARPGFTAIVVLTLTLGIGTNTAIFSVVNAALLRPMPFLEPDKLVSISLTNLRRSNNQGTVSYPDFEDWRSQTQAFEQMAAYRINIFTLTGVDDPSNLQGGVVSADLFSLLRVTPILGRVFLSEEDNAQGAGGSRTAILSYGLWQGRFASDPNVIGRTIELNNRSHTVIGVMPPDFRYPIQSEPVELWTTILYDAEVVDGNPPRTVNRGDRYLKVIARLKHDVGIAQAQAEMDSIANALASQYPDTNANKGVRLVSELESMVGDLRTPLLILLSAVGCVLLIACANVANLLLARATTRHKEMAIRAALGASRGRIIRQLLTESLLLSLTGGVLGLLLAWLGTKIIIAISPQNIPRLRDITLDFRVLGFTLFVSLLTGIIFGLAPALHASKVNLTESLKEGARSSSDGSQRKRLRAALVVGEVALALMLLVGAGLLIKTFIRLQEVNPGFDAHNLLTVSINLPAARYGDPQIVGFYEQLVSRIESLPGVDSASVVNPLPLGGLNISLVFDIESNPLPKSEQPQTEYRAVNPGYFKTMHIPLIDGRDFTVADNQDALPVVIINESLSRRFFPNDNPVGKRIKPSIALDKRGPLMRQIIGVVGDVRHKNLQTESGPELYVPHSQIPFRPMTMVIRTNRNTQDIVGSIRSEVKQLDKDLPIYNVKTMDQFMAQALAQARFNTTLLATFATVALILSTIGFYGVMAYTVAQRTREIGVRVALGATNTDVLRLVLGHAMTLALIGIAIGVCGGLVVTNLMSSLLYGVSSIDPMIFIGVAILLFITALLACYIPAQRAMKVDPIIALRYE
jgi:putative ABC transport system permease protein